MKNNVFIFAILLFSSLAMASEHTYVFRYPYGSIQPKETYTVSVNINSDETAAYKVATMKCANHFKEQMVLNQNTIDDIVDVCANPRSK